MKYLAKLNKKIIRKIKTIYFLREINYGKNIHCVETHIWGHTCFLELLLGLFFLFIECGFF